MKHKLRCYTKHCHRRLHRNLWFSLVTHAADVDTGRKQCRGDVKWDGLHAWQATASESLTYTAYRRPDAQRADHLPLSSAEKLLTLSIQRHLDSHLWLNAML